MEFKVKREETIIVEKNNEECCQVCKSLVDVYETSDNDGEGVFICKGCIAQLNKLNLKK